jgi:quinolinate synthase
VRNLADRVASTEGMCRYVKETKAQEIIVGTEVGIIHRLKKENPGKIFYPASAQAVCPNMKLITLEKVLWALEDMQPEIDVPPEIAAKARRCIERMLEYS